MDWVSKAWRFLQSEKNRQALAFIGAGITAVAIGGWQVYTHFAASGDAEAPAETIKARDGGLASGGDIPITQSAPGTLIVGGVHGVRPEDFQRVSEELGVTKAALTSFFKILEKKNVPPEDLDSTLREFAKRYKELEADLARSTSDDPEVATLRARAREALKAGDFDRTEELLNEASAEDLAAAERQESQARQRRLSAAQAKAQNGDLKCTQFAYREAAEYFRQAAGLLPADAEKERAEYLNRQGRVLYNAGDYRDAEELLSQALALREKTLGPEHPDVATSLNNLAFLYNTEGQYADTEPLYQRALAIYEKAHGPEHPHVAISLNNLAILYQAQGHYDKAEPLYRRSLAISEKNFGPEHPDVAQFLDNLALLHGAQGQYTKAEPLHERALAIREKTLGPEHPDVATSLNNLAVLYEAQGRSPRAERLFRRSLAIWKKTFGPDHPYVAQSLNNLGWLYSAQGWYAKAEPLYNRALAIQEKILGPEHPDVATSLNNLARLYDAQGQYAKAEPHFKRALAIAEKALGPEHPNVVTFRKNYAASLRAAGRTAEADALETRISSAAAKSR